MPAYTDQFEEAFYIYSYRFRNFLGALTDRQLFQPMKINGDADFVWRAFMTGLGRPARDDWTAGLPFCSIRLQLPDTRSIMNTAGKFGTPALPSVVPTQGTGSFPFPMIPEVLLSKNSTLYADLLSDIIGFTSAPFIDLRGVKLLKKGTRFTIPAGARYDTTPFTYWVPLDSTQTAAGLRAVGTQSLTLDSDSDFLLYSIEGPNSFGSVQFRFFGPEGEETSTVIDQGTPQPGLISFSSLSGQGRFPGAICPPMAYPAGGRISYDYVIPAAGIFDTNVQYIGFRGAKLFSRKTYV